MSSFGGSGSAVGAPQPRFASIAEAAQAQNLDAVFEMLSSQGYNINAQDHDGNTALHWGSWFKLQSLVTRLLDLKARADVGNQFRETAVHWAAKSSNVLALDAMTKADRGLLSQGDSDGFTPFIISAQNDNCPAMEWMYLKGISVEEQDNWGRTALQWACYKGNRRTVQWLLSRSANVAHRDHEGMTAIHWAALKGYEQAAEMLLDVGAVQLLHVADAAGDTPITLAVRKKNRYLVLCFHKCQLFQFLFGRPYISRNHYANLFVCFIAFNTIVFAFIVAPGIAPHRPQAILSWCLLMGGSLVLWVQNCFADPGWIRPQTIFPQHRIIGDDPSRHFDVDQPVESQMAHADSLGMYLTGAQQNSSTNLARLELEQNKYNYQRQLITEARRRLDEGFESVDQGLLVGPCGAEMQPLMNETGKHEARFLAASARQEQLDRAAMALRERELATGENIGRARIEALLAQGGGEYLKLLEVGDFKQVCVVCRARKRMRSHHCKECGRCVERSDHHCPWIDNCVGFGNQRSFYCFIVSLLASIMGFYYVVMLYFLDAVFPEVENGSLAGFFDSISNGSLGPLLRPLVVLVSAASDLIWLAFVGALVARHTANISVNMTTYEVLIRPAHVQRRFPRTRGRFFYLQNFGILDAFRHCFNYWTLNTEQDVADFLGAVPQDSFVAPTNPQEPQPDSGPDRRKTATENPQQWHPSDDAAQRQVFPQNDAGNAFGGEDHHRRPRPHANSWGSPFP